MSGLFVIVWDEKQRDQTQVLRATRGGWPHITLAYTGKELTVPELSSLAVFVWPHVGRSIVLQEAYVNSFEMNDGRIRHDVLMRVNDAELEKIRGIIRLSFHERALKFNMQPLHVSYGVDYPSLEAAKQACTLLNDTMLPYTVTLTGLTFD